MFTEKCKSKIKNLYLKNKIKKEREEYTQCH